MLIERKHRQQKQFTEGNHLRIKLLGAALISLVIAGSLFAITRSGSQVTAVNTVAASALCDSSHAAQSSEAISEADSDLSASDPPVIAAGSAPIPARDG